MANKIISNLTPKTSPAAADVLAIEDTEATKKIDYNALADAILNKITSKTYSVAGSTQTLISAIDALNSNLTPIAHRDIDWLTDVDANEYITTGFYPVKTGTNIPGTWIILEVIATRTDTVVQYAHTNTVTWYRQKRITWSDWIILPTRSEIDALNNSIVPFLKLTYNSTSGRFEPPANTPKLADAQITFVVRNVQTGAIYVIYYVYSENSFSIAATIQGNAPSNGNNAFIMAVR